MTYWIRHHLNRDKKNKQLFPKDIIHLIQQLSIATLNGTYASSWHDNESSDSFDTTVCIDEAKNVFELHFNFNSMGMGAVNQNGILHGNDIKYNHHNDEYIVSLCDASLQQFVDYFANSSTLNDLRKIEYVKRTKDLYDKHNYNVDLRGCEKEYERLDRYCDVHARYDCSFHDIYREICYSLNEEPLPIFVGCTVTVKHIDRYHLGLYCNKELLIKLDNFSTIKIWEGTAADCITKIVLKIDEDVKYYEMFIFKKVMCKFKSNGKIINNLLLRQYETCVSSEWDINISSLRIDLAKHDQVTIVRKSYPASVNDPVWKLYPVYVKDPDFYDFDEVYFPDKIHSKYIQNNQSAFNNHTPHNNNNTSIPSFPPIMQDINQFDSNRIVNMNTINKLKRNTQNSDRFNFPQLSNININNNNRNLNCNLMTSNMNEGNNNNNNCNNMNSNNPLMPNMNYQLQQFQMQMQLIPMNNFGNQIMTQNMNTMANIGTLNLSPPNGNIQNMHSMNAVHNISTCNPSISQNMFLAPFYTQNKFGQRNGC